MIESAVCTSHAQVSGRLADALDRYRRAATRLRRTERVFARETTRANGADVHARRVELEAAQAALLELAQLERPRR